MLNKPLLLLFKFEFLNNRLRFPLKRRLRLRLHRPSPLLAPNRLIILNLLPRPLDRPADRGPALRQIGRGLGDGVLLGPAHVQSLEQVLKGRGGVDVQGVALHLQGLELVGVVSGHFPVDELVFVPWTRLTGQLHSRDLFLCFELMACLQLPYFRVLEIRFRVVNDVKELLLMFAMISRFDMSHCSLLNNLHNCVYHRGLA